MSINYTFHKPELPKLPDLGKLFWALLEAYAPLVCIALALVLYVIS